MIFLFLCVTVLTSLIYIVSFVRRGAIARSTMWFVALTLVFFLYSFTLTWSESGFDDLDPLAEGALAVSLGTVTFIAGDLVSRAVRGSGAKRADGLILEGVDTPRTPTPEESRRRTRGLVAVSLAILIPAWAYFALLGHVPLLMGVNDVVSSGYAGLGALQTYRLELTPHLSGASIPMKGLFDIARNYGPLFIIGVCTVQMLLGEKRGIRVVLIGLGIVTSLAAGQRWPLIYLVVVALTSIYALVPWGVRPRGRRVAGFGALLLLLGMGVTLLQKRTTETINSLGSAVEFVFENLFQRIVFEQSATPILSFQRGSFQPGELGGSSYVQALLAHLPGSDVQNFEVDFFSRVYGSSYGFTAAPGFTVEAYYNFGLLGVALIGFLWGYLLSTIDASSIWTKDVYFTPGFKAAAVALLAGTSFAGIGLLIASGLLLLYVFVIYRLAASPAPRPRADRTAARGRREFTRA
ncbi:hypothetical protein [Microbacterium sp.]|uniref:hypothetical protein n=1 Tax=Microbacterium sp. TaxID=51671 RepID=UPI003A9115DB